MDNRRAVLIAQLRHDERWKALCEELDDLEKIAFEGVFSKSATKEEIAGAVEAYRTIRKLPEKAADKLNNK